MQVVEYGLQPVVSPAALQRSAADLQHIVPSELVHTAGAVHHPPLDHDTQVLRLSRPLEPGRIYECCRLLGGCVRYRFVPFWDHTIVGHWTHESCLTGVAQLQSPHVRSREGASAIRRATHLQSQVGHTRRQGYGDSRKEPAEALWRLQAWADNLLLTARKLGAPLDRRRDGSQESCTSAALHNLQQELGMARQAAQGESSLASCPCGRVSPLSSHSGCLTTVAQGRWLADSCILCVPWHNGQKRQAQHCQ